MPAPRGFSDTDGDAGATCRYEVRAVVDGQERPACNAVTVTSIPFFPGAVGLVGIAVAALRTPGCAALDPAWVTDEGRGQ